MSTTTVQGFSLVPRGPLFTSRKELFREQFQRSLRSCLRRGFSVEESFGMIWVETWEEVAINEREQAELYEELIGWAKSAANKRDGRVIHQGY